MTTTRTALREEISKRLLPALFEAGYRGPAILKGNAILHEFRRPTADGTHVLTIQFEKHGLPRFILLFYIEPTGGMNDVISNGGSVQGGSLKSKKGAFSRSWFRADPTIWQRIFPRTRALEVAAVDSCIGLLPELESWWQSQQPTSHIDSWPTKYPGVNKSHAN